MLNNDAFLSSKCLAVDSNISSANSKSLSDSTASFKQWYRDNRLTASLAELNGVTTSGLVAPDWSAAIRSEILKYYHYYYKK